MYWGIWEDNDKPVEPVLITEVLFAKHTLLGGLVQSHYKQGKMTLKWLVKTKGEMLVFTGWVRIA